MCKENLNLLISFMAFITSIISICIAGSQYYEDYRANIIVEPGTYPIEKIRLNNNDLNLVVQNTSKKNLYYFIRVETNIGCINGEKKKPILAPCMMYESQILGLSKIDIGKSSYKHKLKLKAEVVENNIDLKELSDPNYYITVNIVNAKNMENIFYSKCYYLYNYESKVFVLDQPVFDTTGESIKRQKQCFV